jgi:hypothetical protein
MSKELLDDFNVTLEFSVKEINGLLNVLAQSPFIQVVGFINEIQAQAGPQVEQARASLEAVEKAQKNES